jgi:hypothetical protein
MNGVVLTRGELWPRICFHWLYAFSQRLQLPDRY